MVAKNTAVQAEKDLDEEDEDDDVVVDPKSLELVKVRVLKRGDRQVHTGEHHGATGRPKTHRKGAELILPRGIADELEDRGFVEIQDEASGE